MFEKLRRIWQELDPSLYEGSKEPVMRRLDEHHIAAAHLAKALDKKVYVF